MARQTASARRMPQGKGKKASAPTVIVSKRAARSRAKTARKTGRSSRSAAMTHLDAVVRVGTAITFAPTGERLRVAKIEAGKITFEKLP